MTRAAILACAAAFMANAAHAWEVEETRSQLSGQPLAMASVFSENTYPDRLGKPRIAGLHVRCKDRETALIIHMEGVYLTNHGQYGFVRYRLGDNRPDGYPFSVSTDHQALLIDGWAAVGMLKSMLPHTKFVVQITPYLESPATLRFDITGMAKAIEPVRRTCRW